MGKVSIIAKIVIKPEMGTKFIEKFAVLVSHVAANEPDAEHYVLHQLNSDPNTFYVTEIYKDKAAVDAHTTSDAMESFLGKIKDYVKESELLFLTPIKSAHS